MSWFRKKREQSSAPQVESKFITTIEIHRNFAYDAGFRDPEDIVREYDAEFYTPVSPEGAEKLLEDSEARCAALMPITHVLHEQAMFGAYSYADMVARVSDMDDEEKERLLDLIVPFAHIMLMGSLAGLQEYLGDLNVTRAGVR